MSSRSSSRMSFEMLSLVRSSLLILHACADSLLCRHRARKAKDRHFPRRRLRSQASRYVTFLAPRANPCTHTSHAQVKPSTVSEFDLPFVPPGSFLFVQSILFPVSRFASHHREHRIIIQSLRMRGVQFRCPQHDRPISTFAAAVLVQSILLSLHLRFSRFSSSRVRFG